MMRSTFDPFGSAAMCVDKLLGNAYKIVEYVAKNMVHVRRASFYMKNIYDASQRLTKAITLTTPDAAATFVEVPLPLVVIEDEEGNTTNQQLLFADILGWTSTLINTDGSIISEASGLWTVSVTAAGNFHVFVPQGASSEILERPMTILIDFKIPDYA